MTKTMDPILNTKETFIQKMSSKKALFLTALLACIGDQWVKQLVVKNLSPHQPIPLIPNIFQLNLVYNKGAAFSMLSSNPEVLILIASALCLGLLAYSVFQQMMSKLEKIALGLMLGGAVANLVDRLTLGQVIDYLDVVAIHYPIFNLADCCICIGAGLLALTHLGLFSVNKPPQNKELDHKS